MPTRDRLRGRSTEFAQQHSSSSSSSDGDDDEDVLFLYMTQTTAMQRDLMAQRERCTRETAARIQAESGWSIARIHAYDAMLVRTANESRPGRVRRILRRQRRERAREHRAQQQHLARRERRSHGYLVDQGTYAVSWNICGHARVMDVLKHTYVVKAALAA